MTDEQCSGMPATSGVTVDGFPFIMVAFKPNAEDMKALGEGRPLYLMQICKQFSPVSLFTLDENGEANI